MSGLAPAGALTVSVEVFGPGRVTVVGLSEIVRGWVGRLPRDTIPVKPPEGVTVIVELFDDPPATSVKEYLVEVKAKLGPVIVTRISVVWERMWLLVEPSTVTV